ncbi:hypothetical protein ACFLXU_05040 [Chloroflexota bacterium]
MSKKIKVLVSVLVAVVLLTVGVAVPVMAQEKTSLSQEASIADTTPAIGGRQMMPAHGKMWGEVSFAEEQTNRIKERRQNRQEVQERLKLRSRISNAIQNRQHLGVSKGWQCPELPESEV